MTTKNKDITTKTPKNREKEEQVAELVINPAVSSAAVIKAYRAGVDELNVAALNKELAHQANRVADGDVQRMEEILICQAHALDAVFHAMMVKASDQKSIKGAKIYSDTGLKAQRQCRAVLETLTNLKKPKVYVQNLVSNNEFYKNKNTLNNQLQNLNAPHAVNGGFKNKQLAGQTSFMMENDTNALGYELARATVTYGEKTQAMAT
jgi:hypothetical protein